MKLSRFPCATSRLARIQSDWLRSHAFELVKPLNGKTLVVKWLGLSVTVIHCKKRLAVLTTEWLPWLQDTMVHFGIRV